MRNSSSVQAQSYQFQTLRRFLNTCRIVFNLQLIVFVWCFGPQVFADDGKRPKVFVDIPDVITAFEETVAKIRFPDGADVTAKLSFELQGELEIKGDELRWIPSSASVGQTGLIVQARNEGITHQWHKVICVRRPTLSVGFTITGGMLSDDGRRGVVWGSPGTRPRPPLLELAVFGWTRDGEVDVNASSRISTSILKHSVVHSIACAALFGDQVYVVSQPSVSKPDEDWTLQAFRLPDFENVATQSIGSGATELRIIAGRFLVAVGADKNAILRLPDLQPLPSEKLFHPEQSGRVGNCWLLDGLLYDDALSKPQLMATVRLPEQEKRSMQRIEPFPGLVSRTEGATLVVIAPAAEKQRFVEDVHSIPSFDVLGDLAINNNSLFLMQPGAPQLIPAVNVAYAPLQAPLPGEDMLAHLRTKYNLLDVVPRRALASRGDEALLVSTDDMNYFKSTKATTVEPLPTMQFEPRQSVFAFGFDQPQTFQYHAEGAVNFQLSIVGGNEYHDRLMEMEANDGSFRIDLSALEMELRHLARSLVLPDPVRGVARTAAESAPDKPRSKAAAKRLELKKQRDSLELYKQRVSPLLSRLRVETGQRIPLPLIVSVIANNAVGERCAMQHSAFVLVPPSFLNEPPQPSEPSKPSRSAPIVRLPDLMGGETVQKTLSIPDLPSGGSGKLHAPTFIGPALYTGLYSPTISWRKVENATAYRLVVQHEETGKIILDTLIGADPETNNPSFVYTNEPQLGGMHRCVLGSIDRFGEVGQFCAPRRFYCGPGQVLAAVPSIPANAATGESSWAVFDDQGPHLEAKGVWRSVKHDKAVGGALTTAPGDGENIAKWHIPASVGRYEIEVAWPASANFAKDARFTVHDGNNGQILSSTEVDLTKAAVGAVDTDGHTWQKLSVVIITREGIVVEVSDIADGIVALDAIRIRTAPPRY